MRPRFEGQPIIDAYGDSGFRLAEQRFEGSILLTPRGLYPWSPSHAGEATVESLTPIVESAGEFDFFIVGSGAQFARLPADVMQFLHAERIVPDIMLTGAACRTYNILKAENRRVAAALIAVA